MREVITYLLLGLITLNLISSCADVPDCAQESSYVLFKVKLFDVDSLFEEKVKFDSIKSVGSDSLFYTAEDSLSLYAMDLNSSLNTTTFLFYQGLDIDTITVSYDKSVVVPFEECGPSVDISNLVLDKSTFDSTALISDLINFNVNENIEIYQ